MDTHTWNNLTDSERDEIKHMGSDFTKMVLNSNASDGRDFIIKYEIRSVANKYYIYEKSTDERFGDFKSSSKKVMEALMTDAAQNYGR